ARSHDQEGLARRGRAAPALRHRLRATLEHRQPERVRAAGLRARGHRPVDRPPRMGAVPPRPRVPRGHAVAGERHVNPSSKPVLMARQTTAREFLAVVFRRKWLIIGLFLTTTITVAVLSLTTPLVYQSVGRVLVKRGERDNALQVGRQVYSQWEEGLASELEIG